MKLILSKNIIKLFLLLTFLSACDSPDEIELTTAADLVLINASIYTVDAAQSWAKTMAIKDGYIVYVGPNDEINNFIADNTRVIDLQDKMVIPGMQDAHIHPIMSGIRAEILDLSQYETVAEYRSVIRDYVNTNADVEWVLGGGWSMGAFGTAFTLATNIDFLPMVIYTEFTLSANIAMAAALSISLGLVTWVLLLVARSLSGTTVAAGG